MCLQLFHWYLLLYNCLRLVVPQSNCSKTITCLIFISSYLFSTCDSIVIVMLHLPYDVHNVSSQFIFLPACLIMSPSYSFSAFVFFLITPYVPFPFYKCEWIHCLFICFVYPKLCLCWIHWYFHHIHFPSDYSKCDMFSEPILCFNFVIKNFKHCCQLHSASVPFIFSACDWLISLIFILIQNYDCA